MYVCVCVSFVARRKVEDADEIEDPTRAPDPFDEQDPLRKINNTARTVYVFFFFQC